MSERKTRTEFTTFKPGPEMEATEQGQPKPMGEPSPEWSTASEALGIAWHLHQYALGALFGILGILAGISLVRYHKRPANRRTKVPYVVLTLLVLFGWTRSLFLLLDAYHSRKLLPTPVLNLLWGIGQPCIVTAYSLIFVVLRNALVLQQQFKNWYTTRNIALVTTPYFVLTLSVELTAAFVPNLKALTFICQLIYILFGFLLASFYIFVSVLMWRKFRPVNIQMGRFPGIPGMTDRGRRTRVVQRLCLATVFGGFAICGMQIYAMTDIYGVFADVQFVPPWPWFVFHTISRLLELYMAVLLYCIVVQKKCVVTARSERSHKDLKMRIVQ